MPYFRTKILDRFSSLLTTILPLKKPKVTTVSTYIPSTDLKPRFPCELYIRRSSYLPNISITIYNSPFKALHWGSLIWSGVSACKPCMQDLSASSSSVIDILIYTMLTCCLHTEILSLSLPLSLALSHCTYIH